MEIVEKVKELKGLFEEWKGEHEKRLEALEKGDLATLLKDKSEAMEQRMEELSEQIKVLEKEAARPVQSDFKSKEEEEHFKAFDNFLRNPRDHKAQGRLIDAQKAVQTTVSADGGYAVPEVIDTNITDKLIDVSPMRAEASVVTVGTPDWKTLVNVRGQAYGWVGETDTRTETDTSKFAEVAPTFGTIYAYPKATEESLNDMFFDVASWIVDESSVAIAEGEGIAFTTGDGTKKPTGALAGLTAATGDEDSPARAFGTIEHVASGVAANFPNDRLGSPPGNPGDLIYDLIYKLKAGYRNGAKFMMNKATLGVIRKWKDANGNYLWQPAVAAGQPSTLAGYPVIENEAMADVGANALVIAFGNFKAAYVIADLVGTRITVDEITTPGYTKFYVRKRVGGKLKNDDAVKVLKIATS